MTNSTVVKILLFLLLGLALSSSLVRAELPQDFAAIDVSRVLADARASAGESATKVGHVGAGFRRYDRDCVGFRFSGDTLRSDRVRLRSQEWVEECYWVPGDPRRGGGRRECHTRPGFSYSETVSVALTEAKPRFPWESDAFRVCLEGPWLNVWVTEASYKYRWVNDRRDGDIVLAPEEKVAMRPDPSGLSPAALSPDMVLRVDDRWASYYGGETAVLKLTLRRHVSNWPDYDIVSAEVELPAAPNYLVDLKRFSGQFSEELRSGKEYYVKVSFVRKGRVSTDEEVSAGESPRARYAPGGQS